MGGKKKKAKSINKLVKRAVCNNPDLDTTLHRSSSITEHLTECPATARNGVDKSHKQGWGAQDLFFFFFKGYAVWFCQYEVQNQEKLLELEASMVLTSGVGQELGKRWWGRWGVVRRKCSFLIWRLVPSMWRFVQLYTDYFVNFPLCMYFNNK